MNRPGSIFPLGLAGQADDFLSRQQFLRAQFGRELAAELLASSWLTISTELRGPFHLLGFLPMTASYSSCVTSYATHGKGGIEGNLDRGPFRRRGLGIRRPHLERGGELTGSGCQGDELLGEACENPVVRFLGCILLRPCGSGGNGQGTDHTRALPSPDVFA